MIKPIESLQIVDAKVIMNLLGCSQATAYRKIQAIKKEKRNPDKAMITLTEFCEYYEIKK